MTPITATKLREAQPPSRLRKLASALLDRWRFSQRLSTFDGRRNVSNALGYATILQVADYRDRYERGGIAERIVEAYPNATWAGGARLVEDPDPTTETIFESSVRQLFDRLELWQRLNRADILAGLGTYAVLLIGAPGKMDEPLPDKLNGPEDIKYVTALAEDRAVITEYYDGPKDEELPEFGLPKFYNLSLGTTRSQVTGRVVGQSILRKVHASRVIHVAEGMLEDDIYGKPRLRASWNHLDDLIKVVGGGAEAAWNRMNPGLHVNVPDDVMLDSDEEQELSDEIDEYIHGQRRTIRSRGDTTIEPLAASVAGFGPNATAILQLIAGATGIPLRLLLGSERGELASTQDRLNWADRINERRRGHATPLVRRFINRLIERNVLPRPEGPVNPIKPGERALRASVSPDIHLVLAKAQLRERLEEQRKLVDPIVPVTDSIALPSIPGGFEIMWPEVGEVDNLTKASVIGKIAAANQAQAQTGQPVILETNEIRHIVLGLGPTKAGPSAIGVAKTTNINGTSEPNPGGSPAGDQSIAPKMVDKAATSA